MTSYLKTKVRTKSSVDLTCIRSLIRGGDALCPRLLTRGPSFFVSINPLHARHIQEMRPGSTHRVKAFPRTCIGHIEKSVKSNTQRYHGRSVSAGRTAGRRDAAGLSRTGVRPVGWPRSQPSLQPSWTIVECNFASTNR